MRESYKVPCIKGKRLTADTVTVKVPGSKSITNRALLIAAAARGNSVLHGCLTSDDARYFLDCINKLGFVTEIVSHDELNVDIKIEGCGGKIPQKTAELYVGSAGTAARFLVAMLALSDGEYTVNSSPQMQKRPMQPLIDAVRSAGATVICTQQEGHFPLKIIGAGKNSTQIPAKIEVNIDKSSQFLSALLIAAGAADRDMEIVAVGQHGLSYVNLTAQMMKQFGCPVAISIGKNGSTSYKISGENCYTAKDYYIEPDLSAAAYFYAMAAVLKTGIAVSGVKPGCMQGDIAFVNLLCQMGCSQYLHEGNIAVKGNTLTGGFEADMSAFSDQALTLSAIAPYADTPIKITGISHIRLQECDRMAAIVNNLAALGIETQSDENSITIFPAAPHSAEIETYDDHRTAMSFAITGLLCDGVVIKNPDCCKKTFEQYFEVLEKTIGKLTEL